MHGGGGGGSGAPACETVNVWPATVSVPVRAAPVFAATVNATEPLPVPEAPLEIVIQSALDEALQAQVLPAVTAVDPLPPEASTDWLAGEME